MRRLGPLLVLFCLPVLPRQVTQTCGTSRDTAADNLFLHRQATRARRARLAFLLAPRVAPNDRDLGNIAVIEDSGGVVDKLNQFNLNSTSLTFTPVTGDAARYRYAISSPTTYSTTAADQGTPLVGLGDDDAREVTLPFPFPFFGATYRKLFVNSDGNLTFNAAENASASRSTGRVTGGPPRIAALFDDLDPSLVAAAVRIYSTSSAWTVSWIAVPEFSDFGRGVPQTFQITLTPDGRIVISYSAVNPSSAVVGIAPGSAQGLTTLTDFLNDASGDYTAAVVEHFGDSQEIDVVLAAQRFFQTHEDAYDYLVIYNNAGIGAMPGALAYESTIRSSGSGWGVPAIDNGAQYGSPSRLRSVLNMGPLSQYPTDPNGFVPARGASNDSPLTILGHEAGHLFLALASIPDPANPSLKPMLGYGGVHWSFVFNSEASLDEGEQILDRGANASPRFITAAVTQHYSPLDQYLMGFRPPSAVPPTFVITGYNSRLVSPDWHPAGGVTIDGTPIPVTTDDLVKVEGRRTPDYTVAQRRFRFGFVLVVPAGTTPSDAEIAKLEAYRAQFVEAYDRYTDSNASAETNLRRALKLSIFPASGVVAGSSAEATLSIQSPAPADLLIGLSAPNGFAQVPPAVRLPAGQRSVHFTITGVRAGVEELSAVPTDASFEVAFARIQVAALSQVKLTVLSSAADALTVRLSDANDLPYAGTALTAVTPSPATVSPARIVTDQQGIAVFRWTYPATSTTQLTVAVEGAPAVSLTLKAGAGVAAIGAVVNAASYSPGITPGGIATIFGTNLDPAAPLTLNGAPLQAFYASATQINFYVPQNAPTGPVTIASGSAQFATTSIPVDAGIFAVVPHPGYLEIYATGLGPTRVSGDLQVTATTPTVFFGSTPVTPLFAGLAPGFTGLYQINVAIPAGLSGPVNVLLSSGRSVSNAVAVTLP